jgi:hypothetical protein
MSHNLLTIVSWMRCQVVIVVQGGGACALGRPKYYEVSRGIKINDKKNSMFY